jgi:hypothetical protein
MKSIVIYYSQAGSTKKIAQAIHRGMSRLEARCEIAQVKDVDPADLAKYDLIGLGSPIWMGGPTPNVRIFIESIPKQKKQHIFSFNTHGVMPELYFPSVVSKLILKGLTVIGTKDWFGDYHYQLAPSPYYTAGHPDDIDLSAIPQKFGSEGDRCDMWMGCTFCELICLTGAISGNWDEIIARESEEPAGAIVGYNLLEKKADDAVAEGCLRMLVSKEDIRWDKPCIKVHSKHPRLKLPKDE